MQSIENRVREYLRETFPSPEHETLGVEESLFDAGILDSIGVMTLATWLEKEFDVFVDDDEVLPENFDGIGPLTRYVSAKLGVASPEE
ncbi:MAG: acyl carrier protein [Dokdonella sp.]